MTSAPDFLRVLLLGSGEATPIARALEAHGFQPLVTGVVTAAAFRTALDAHEFDAIIAEQELPDFSGLDALAVAQEYGYDVPFILLSRTEGEELAVEAMRAGAHDYVLTSNLQRLGPAIERELAEVGTRRERADHQRLILESEARFRATFEQLAVGLLHLASDGRCLRVNQRACQITGWSRADLEGQDFRVLFGPADRDGSTERLRAILAGEIERCTAEILLTRRDGSTVWAQLTANLAHAPDAGESYVILAIEDISERRAAEIALRESEARYRMLLEQASDGIFIRDASGRLLEVNDSATAMLGFSRKELLAMSIHDLVPAEDTTSNPLVVNALAPGESAIVARRLRRKDAPPLDVEISIKRLHDGTTQSIVRDLSERYEAQRRMELSETRFLTIAAATNDAVYDRDLATDEVWWNENFFRLFGHTPGADSAVSSWWLSHIHEDDRDAVAASLDLALVSKTTVFWEYRFRRADGSYCYVIDRAYILRDSGGRPVRMIGSMMDITSRKITEEALRSSEERFRALIENASDIIAVIDRKGMFRYHSPAIERVLGYRPEELAGHSALEHVHPADRERVEATFIEGLDHPQEMRRIEHRMIHRDGTVRHIETIGKNMLGHSAVDGIVVTSRDITERKLIESKLEQAQRLTSLGKLAANVAHEFNNVMMGIQAFAAVVARESGESTRLLRASGAITTSIERGRRITQEILRFTQSPEPIPAPFDVRRWLDDTRQEIAASLGPYVALAIEVAPGVTVMGDRRQLTQALTNLALNARDAIGDRDGRFTIRASQPEAGERYDFGVVESPEKFIRLEVSDTGSGISEAAIAHIFEPLFTTRRGSMGLGLAVVHQMIMRHGGHVFVESTEGAGTTFHIFLPSAPASDADEPRPAEPSPQPRVDAKTVLLVEDDPLVAEGLAALLAMEGFEVAVAGTVAHARKEFAARVPDIVLLDVGLPDGDGVDLSHELRAQVPDLRIIFSTGHGDEARLGGLKSENLAFLQKPYTPERLREVLARTLGRSRSAES